jgi:DNA (cytosine-5)-methyltransferase 1
VKRENYPDLLKKTIALLGEIDKPFVVENVPGSESEFGMLFWNVLCGVQFGLKLFRHRIFGSNKLILFPHKCNHSGRKVGKDGFVCMVGHGDANAHHGQHVPADHRNKAAWVNASGIDWMNRDEMAQAIPPAYTRYLGLQLMEWC